MSDKPPITNLFYKVNICGKSYEIPTSLLEESEYKSRLNDISIETLNFHHTPVFYNSLPSVFEEVLLYHRSGVIHAPKDLCADNFLRELDFWQISQDDVAACCRAQLGLTEFGDKFIATEVNETEITKANEKQLILTLNGNSLLYNGTTGTSRAGSIKDIKEQPNPYSSVCFGDTRRKLWALSDDPNSSKPAKIVALVSALFVAVSVLCLVLGSIDFFCGADGEPVFVLEIVEYACIVWFTIEFVSRAIIVAEKFKFCRQMMNLIDLASILPTYIELSLMLAGVSVQEMGNFKGALLTMRLLKILRVARVLKLARHSSGIMSFLKGLGASRKEIGMLCMFLSITILIFSTTVYFCEKDVPGTAFTSIPATFWWCVVTMTTVGYGDMIPVTGAGKFVASFTTISGVIVLAFPITMIVENFSKEYKPPPTPMPDNYKTPTPKSVAIV